MSSMYPKGGLVYQTRESPLKISTPWAGVLGRRSFITSLAITATILLLLATTAQRAGTRSTPFVQWHKSNMADVRNETLGFERVFAINLPSRPDKRDAMAVQARLTNFTVEFSEGVSGSTVLAKTLPHTMEQSNHTIGWWRAHLDVLSKMIHENIQTALVFEEDVDWDIGFKSQLEEFARGARFLLGSAKGRPFSPYGDNWDILHFGHCESEPRSSDGRRWVIPKDPTVPPATGRSDLEQPGMRKWEDGESTNGQVRVVYMQQYGRCLSAYAVSRRAAQRILYQASMIPFNTSIDVGMGSLCDGTEYSGFNCVASFPRLVGKVRTTMKASEVGDEEPTTRSTDASIMFSIRRNAERMIKGDSLFKSSFPSPLGDYLPLDQLRSGYGHAAKI